MNLFSAIAKGMDKDIPDTSPYYDILNYLNPDSDIVEPEEIFSGISGGDVGDYHLGNMHLSILFNQISSFLSDRSIDNDFFINALDSHFYVHQQSIKSLDDLLVVLQDQRIVIH